MRLTALVPELIEWIEKAQTTNTQYYAARKLLFDELVDILYNDKDITEAIADYDRLHRRPANHGEAREEGQPEEEHVDTYTIAFPRWSTIKSFLCRKNSTSDRLVSDDAFLAFEVTINEIDCELQEFA